MSFIGVGLASWHRREEEVDDGEWYDAHDSIVRAATAEEAAPVLAAEAKRARRAALARRVRNLLTVNRYEPAADCHRPVAEELAGVSFGTEVPIPGSVAGTTHPTTVYVDQESGFVWTWIHNGLDNDDWSVNNLGGAVAVRHPLTPERQALIADLYAEYDNPAALAKEIGAAETAVAALLDARWTGRQIRDSRRLFRLSEPGDGAALAALTPGQWREAGWWDEFWRPPGFAPGDAARLADAGISPATARDLGGTVEEILAAGPPRLPADASRILILPPEGERTTSMWAVAGMSAELVSAYLAGSPRHWGLEIRADAGPHPVHVTRDWQVWDDSMLTRAHWVHKRPHRWEKRGDMNTIVYDDDPAWPQRFTDAGERLISRLLDAVNVSEVFTPHKEHWFQVAADAEGVEERKVEETRRDRHSGGCGTTLLVHTITRSGHPDEQLWQVDEDQWYRGEDADAQVTTRLYRNENDVRDDYRHATRNLG
ncbi:hypothetical protein ACWEPC_35785 [Nonomuraea sp. NPDC004297]